MKTRNIILPLVWVALICGTTARASVVYEYGFDSIGTWQVGGAQAGTTQLTIDTAFKTEGTGSFQVEVTFPTSSFAYADVYNDQLPGAPLDFSAGPISFDFSSSDVNAKVLLRLATVSHGVYEVVAAVSEINAWESFTFAATDFTADPQNISDVNLIQFRFIGDDLSSFPETVTYHLDNMVVGTQIPEPSQYAMVAGALILALGLLRRRARLDR